MAGADFIAELKLQDLSVFVNDPRLRVAILRRVDAPLSLEDALEYLGREVPVVATEIRDLKRATALNLKAFIAQYGAHTDGLLEARVPEYVALYCVTPDLLGFGGNLFWRPEDVIRDLPPAAVECLSKTPVYYDNPSYASGRPRSSTIVLEGGADRPVVRWRWDGFARPSPLKDPQSFQKAALSLWRSLETSPFYRVDCRAGDLMIIKNLDILHGRTPLSSDASSRHVKRAWIWIGSPLTWDTPAQAFDERCAPACRPQLQARGRRP